MKKTIVITGAGSGLGKMSAIALAKRGHLVYATTHYTNEAKTLNDYAKENFLPLEAFKLDILIKEDREKLKDIEFDVLINNAAIGDSGSVAEIDIERIKSVYEINIFSNIQLTQIAIEKFIKKKNGRIIFLSSLAGRLTTSFLSPYTSSKFAIEALAMSLRCELKKLDGVNIQVTLIEPGAYATGFNKENLEKKYEWMKNKSYFKYKLDEIHLKEERKWKLMESNNYNSIIKKYIKAVEVRKVRKRYSAPFLQSLLIQLGRIFGM